MIYYSVPYDIDKNIGKYYNDFMKILPNDDDYACFVDGDTIFTTSNYGSIIHQVVSNNPNVGCYTSYTNRIGCEWQIVPGVDQNSNDMLYHRNLGQSIQTIYGTTTIDVTDKSPLSGHFILLRKSLWRKIGGFDESIGMLGVDNDLHLKIRNIGEKIHLMRGVYLFHWYRWPNPKNKSHLL